ncbi:MAG: aminoacyl-tRNA hydrolase [Phycisphaerae bacterium]|nr:aminoacyl-tRNA hydrolase [Phycisphaerae bacterium]
MIQINKTTEISEDELTYDFSRSSGPGGQNVNKVNTRVTLYFNVKNSPSLTDFKKKTITAKLRTRINKEGVLRVISQKHRTQAANKMEATNRLIELLKDALTFKPPRKKTKPSKASIKRRLENKKQRSQTKQLRKPVV